LIFPFCFLHFIAVIDLCATDRKYWQSLWHRP
jgi:hypothetical protein